MNRREVIKGLGLTLGYAVATPTVISILQSCKSDSEGITWKPQFLSKDEGNIINNLVDLILPKTDDTPGAQDVHVAKFIDLYLDKVSNKEKQDSFKKGMTVIFAELGKPVNKLSIDDYDSLLSKYLRVKPNELDAFENNENDTIILKTLTGLRWQTIWVYKNSQLIGEEVLAYDPIPGKQLGCISLEDTTRGKAWSL